MQIKNGLVFCDDFTLREEEVYAEGDRIAECADGEIIDASGCIVAPGFIECHIHGALLHDFCEGTQEANKTISAYLASAGITSYLGTTMAMPPEALRGIVKSAADFMDTPLSGCAVMRGINLEGPFISKEKKGAMQEKFISAPNIELLEELSSISGNRIVFVDVAPELDGCMNFIRQASKSHVVSLAHTNADYDTAKEAFLAGATHVTHLYNAMSPFSHREPGVIGAAMDHAEHVELICDGVHSHPASVRAAFRMFCDDRICMISDAIMACGIPDGEYELGGQKVILKNGLVTLGNGTIAGSAAPLSEGFRRAVKLFDIPLVSALKAVTINPARAIGMENEIGSITPGKRADFTILDAETLKVRHCIIGGKIVF